MIPDDISILVQKTYDFDDMSMFDAVTAQVQKAMDDHKRQVEKLEQNAETICCRNRRRKRTRIHLTNG